MNYIGDILLVGINYDKNSKKHQCIIEKTNFHTVTMTWGEHQVSVFGKKVIGEWDVIIQGGTMDVNIFCEL